MKLTEEQINILSQWENNFHTAVKADWASNPGTQNLRVIYDIFTQVTGDQRRFNDNCNTCILHLLQDCGRIYFADKEELLARKNEMKAVEMSVKAAKPIKKASVKTRKEI